MSFFGKTYTLDSEENFKEFVESLGIPDDKVDLLLNFKPSQSLTKDGDEYTLTSTTPDGGSKDVKFQDGVEFDEEVAPGVVAKSTFTVDGDVVTQNQVIGDTTLTYKREFSDDGLVVVITTSKWDGTARRFYK